MEPHISRLFAIALGGAVGAVCRYGVVLASMRQFGERFPIGVLAANVVGCFLLGLLMHESWIESQKLSGATRAALAVGFLGALTTFSTFGYDTLRLIEVGRPGMAMINVVANCILGVAACYFGGLAGNSLAQN